ncbi:MAG: phosphomannomutase/phosphoglucomutase [Spirochaetes bacterium]|nr:phosphomannomutase/phosphoglucomutase [Spirochaetota bacterium]
MEIDWKKLQNGSDIRGVAVESADEKVNLSPEIASMIGSAFVKWLCEKKSIDAKDVKIAVGTDSRISGTILKNGIMRGILSLNSSPFDAGLASTPAMFMSAIFEEFKCDGAVMVTASHLPFNRNGFKFFTSDGGLEKNDISKILAIAEHEKPYSDENVTCKKIDLMDRYSNLFIEKIRSGINSRINYNSPLKGMKIAVDAGNGAGGFFVDRVLKPLGADTSGSRFLDPDGMFPNHEPNPENNKAMDAIKDAVIQSGSDLGIIFDTDVDRAAIVDGSGEIINRNRLIALAASIVLDEHPNTTIVTDSVTSDGLTLFIEKNLCGRHHRFRRGYKNVINEALRLNNLGEECHLAIETSGHGALKENYFLDDGAYLVAKIIIMAARLNENSKSIMTLLKGLIEPVEEEEFRVKLLDDNFTAQGESIIESLKDYLQSINGWSIVPNNFEGIRISCRSENEKGWFLLRLSLHDPVLPLNIESEISGGVKTISKKIAEFLKSINKIDYSQISEYIENR